MNDPKDTQDKKAVEIEDGEMAEDQLDGVSGGGVFAKLGDFKRPVRKSHNSILDRGNHDSIDN